MAFGARRFHAGFLMKKSPITAEELKSLRERLGVGQADPWTGQQPHIYYPTAEYRGAKPDEIVKRLAEVVTAPDLRSVYASNWVELAPATDNRPFFNEPVRWSAMRPWMFRKVLAGGNQVAGDLPVAAGDACDPVRSSRLRRRIPDLASFGPALARGLSRSRKWSILTYFAGLGLGFIMIEIVFLQWFSLFLGEPVYTYAVVLASMLIFTGAGSFLTSFFPENPSRMLITMMVALLGVLAATTLVTPWIFTATLGLSMSWRVAIAVAVIAPLGLLLGMPFPIGVRIVAKEAPALVPWGWGVNGFCTVIGSVAR